jgi:hypothetical protein
MTPQTCPSQPAPKSDSPEDRKLDLVLGRVDLAAILTAVVGLCLLGLMAAALAAVESAKLISCLWAHPVARWPLVIFGLAIVWILTRRKRLCVI